MADRPYTGNCYDALRDSHFLFHLLLYDAGVARSLSVATPLHQ